MQHATLECPERLGRQEFTVNGLAQTQTDVLLRVDYLDGSSSNQRLTPDAPLVVIPERPSALRGRAAHTPCSASSTSCSASITCCSCSRCCCSCDGVGRLVATVTAFTVAHSITLGAATLGFVHVPSAPVEAVIALSILFLASELARRALAAPAASERAAADLTARFPWIVAFSFGLLHGFGFAGALSEVGDARSRPCRSRCCSSTSGVEIGQLLFIAAVLGDRVGSIRSAAAERVPLGGRAPSAYGIGSVAAFWAVERTLAIF